MAAADQTAILELARVLAKLEIHAARQTTLLEEIADELCGTDEEGGTANGEPKGDIERIMELKDQLSGLADLKKPKDQPTG